MNIAPNLVDNAVDAMNGNGTLTVRTRTEGDWIVVEIADTGSGMAPEVAARAFEPFFSTKDVGRGTGLGLDIARRIVVERHAGLIDIDTPAHEGTGTVMRVSLPLEGPRLTGTWAPSTAASGAGASAPRWSRRRQRAREYAAGRVVRDEVVEHLHEQVGMVLVREVPGTVGTLRVGCPASRPAREASACSNGTTAVTRARDRQHQRSRWGRGGNQAS